MRDHFNALWNVSNLLSNEKMLTETYKISSHKHKCHNCEMHVKKIVYIAILLCIIMKIICLLKMGNEIAFLLE